MLDMSKTMGVMDMPEKIEQSISGNQPGERYVCPMHPEEVSHKSGSCSKCGMFLVKQDINIV